jgi:esterase/lipase superfamily enzyme
MVGFSWPANGSVLDYSSDRIEAVSSAPALANMINAIHQANPNAKVFIIAHSMGNFLTCHMLKGLVEKQYSPYASSEGNRDKDEKARLSYRGIDGGEKKFFVDGYFMLAPDIERRQVTKCYKDSEPTYDSEQISKDPKAEEGKKQETEKEKVYYIGPFFEGLFHLVGGVYLFYSRHDQALKASKVEKELRERKGAVKEFIVGRNMENRRESKLWDDNQWDDNRWEDSLGLNPAPPVAPPNLYSFNASTLANMQIDHGNYFDTRGVVETIAHAIFSYRSPDEDELSNSPDQ